MQRMITVTANIADTDLGTVTRQVDAGYPGIGQSARQSECCRSWTGRAAARNA